MKTFNCLIIDDETELLDTLTIYLKREMNIASQSATTIQEAKNLLSQKSYDLCITDMVLEPPYSREGLELIEYIGEHYPNIPTILITAFGDMESAIKAFRGGAFDYITKPLDFKALRKVIQSALPELTQSNQKSLNSGPELIGTSKPIQELRQQIQKVARSEAAIHISGESGSGKELVARLIHYHSTRRDKPFIPVNCGAIPESLVESELFGHKKGSFTGANADRKGLFEEAKGGTLFLDEVSELPLNMQVKLLRALQEKSVRPVGANKEISIDVRIISATHQNLLNLVNEGEFREDLYFRIRVFELQVPPLRERVSDISLLIEHIIKRLRPNKKYTLTDKALSDLEKHNYRGNVRELENIIEAAMTLCTSNKIRPKDLEFIEQELQLHQLHHQLPSNSNIKKDDEEEELKPNQILTALDKTGWSKDDEFECNKMFIALEKTGWNKSKATKLLDWTWGRFRHRYKKYKLEKLKPF